jgi:inorganic pyrophosphatase
VTDGTHLDVFDLLAYASANDPRTSHLQELEDVPMHLIPEIWHFFEIHEALEPGKSPSGSGGWERRKEAIQASTGSRKLPVSSS